MEERVRPRSVKFSDLTWSIIQRQARVEGVSASQYIREAAIMRAFYEAGHDGDPALARALDEIRRGRD